MYSRKDYNWYSTNSKRQYEQQTIQPTQTAYPDDRGRHPLGSVSDAESVEVRERSVGSVSDETIQKWADFQTEMREKCSLRNNSHDKKIDEKLRTFPKKKWEIEDFDDDSSQKQQRIEYDRSKYKFVRKAGEENRNEDSISDSQSTTSSVFSKKEASEDDDCQVVLVSSSSSEAAKKNAPPAVIDEKSGSTQKEAPTKYGYIYEKTDDSADSEPVNNNCQVAQVATSSSSPQKENSPPIVASSSEASTPNVTIPLSPSTPTPSECILNKYGHCFAPKSCPFAHKIQKVGRGKRTVATGWKRKLPNVPLCSGYFNFQCWNFDCEMRHVVYPSDIN